MNTIRTMSGFRIPHTSTHFCKIAASVSIDIWRDNRVVYNALACRTRGEGCSLRLRLGHQRRWDAKDEGEKYEIRGKLQYRSHPEISNVKVNLKQVAYQKKVVAIHTVCGRQRKRRLARVGASGSWTFELQVPLAPTLAWRKELE